MGPGFKPLEALMEARKLVWALGWGCLTRVGTAEQEQKRNRDEYTVGIKNTWSVEDLEVELVCLLK